jgi:hypothetical protein
MLLKVKNIPDISVLLVRTVCYHMTRACSQYLEEGRVKWGKGGSLQATPSPTPVVV